MLPVRHSIEGASASATSPTAAGPLASAGQPGEARGAGQAHSSGFTHTEAQGLHFFKAYYVES